MSRTPPVSRPTSMLIYGYGTGSVRRTAGLPRQRRQRPIRPAAAQAAQHPGVGEADIARGCLDRGAPPDQVLGAFEAEQLLVAQRRQAGGPAEGSGQGALADSARRGQLTEGQLL